VTYGSVCPNFATRWSPTEFLGPDGSEYKKSNAVSKKDEATSQDPFHPPDLFSGKMPDDLIRIVNVPEYFAFAEKAPTPNAHH
jgi:hypothetical protein